MAAGDLTALASLAHSLKGNAGFIKATHLFGLAKATEQQARTQNPDALQQAAQMALETEAVLQEIAQFLASGQHGRG